MIGAQLGGRNSVTCSPGSENQGLETSNIAILLNKIHKGVPFGTLKLDLDLDLGLKRAIGDTLPYFC